MTDGGFSLLHMTDGALLAFHFSENSAPPNGFGVIPDFDDDVPVPPERDPPKPDDDETLPSKAHPSYPYGRPYASARKSGHPASLSLAHSLFSLSAQTIGPVGGGGGSSLFAWPELGLRDLLPAKVGREVPPGMAGAKRGPEDDRDEDSDDEDELNEDGATQVASTSQGDQSSTFGTGTHVEEASGSSRPGSEGEELMDDGFDDEDGDDDEMSETREEDGLEGDPRSSEQDGEELEDSMLSWRARAQPLARTADWQRRPADDT